MEQTLQVILVAASAFFVGIMLFTAAACAACRKNWGEIPITRPPAATTRLSSTFDPKPVTMAELLEATHNFSPDLIIGRGSFGPVYKARLPHAAGPTTVAVKKLSPDAFQGFRKFRDEVEILSKIRLRHPNIVTMLGYCFTGSDRVLIYDYVENGSLDQWLLLSNPSQPPSQPPRLRLPLSWETTIKIVETVGSRLPLSWETRINIVRGVASGLAYMHNLETPIIYRNIKASKVLLDCDFEPHIADFGLARRIEHSLSHVSTQAAGTMGYMPPEYLQGAAMATAMGDVYSFGILMLEISTGIRPDSPFKEERNGKEVRLVEWAREKVAQNLHMEILDANISRAGLEESGVVEFLRIAFLCASDSSMDRPPMREVVELLNQIPT